MGKIFFGLFPKLNNFYTVSILPYFVNRGRKLNSSYNYALMIYNDKWYIKIRKQNKKQPKFPNWV